MNSDYKLLKAAYLDNTNNKNAKENFYFVSNKYELDKQHDQLYAISITFNANENGPKTLIYTGSNVPTTTSNSNRTGYTNVQNQMNIYQKPDIRVTKHPELTPVGFVKNDVINYDDIIIGSSFWDMAFSLANGNIKKRYEILLRDFGTERLKALNGLTINYDIQLKSFLTYIEYVYAKADNKSGNAKIVLRPHTTTPSNGSIPNKAYDQTTGQMIISPGETSSVRDNKEVFTELNKLMTINQTNKQITITKPVASSTDKKVLKSLTLVFSLVASVIDANGGETLMPLNYHYYNSDENFKQQVNKWCYYTPRINVTFKDLVVDKSNTNSLPSLSL
jgi:hypothetical protein